MIRLYKMFKDAGVKYCAACYFEEKDYCEEPDNKFRVYKIDKPFEDNNKSAFPWDNAVAYNGSFFKYFLAAINEAYYLTYRIANDKYHYPILAAQIKTGGLCGEDGVKEKMSNGKRCCTLIKDQSTLTYN